MAKTKTRPRTRSANAVRRRASRAQHRAFARARAVQKAQRAPANPFTVTPVTEITVPIGPVGPKEFGTFKPVARPIWQRLEDSGQDKLTPRFLNLVPIVPAFAIEVPELTDPLALADLQVLE